MSGASRSVTRSTPRCETRGRSGPAHGGPAPLNDRERPGRGRPRDASIDRAVLDATIALLGAHGYTGLRIEEVARTAGTAKTTIYRRWPTRTHLVVAAIERALGERLPPPATGDLRGDLDRLIEAAFAPLSGGNAGLVSITMDIHRQDDDGLRATYRSRIIDPVRQRAIALAARAQREGIVRSDLAPQVLADAAIGGLVYRTAILGEPMTTAQAKEFVHGLMGLPG